MNVSARLTRTPIKTVILDINGVLYESGESKPIPGSVEGLRKIVQHFNVCLVTNHCTTSKRKLAEKLRQYGFEYVTPDMIVSPAPVACQHLLEEKLTPKFLVADEVLEDFEPIMKQHSPSSTASSVNNGDSTAAKPNCLVIGNAKAKITRDLLDDTLAEMLALPTKPQIISLGASRYYRDCGRLRLGTGSYAAAFEFALGVKALNVGKPSASLFELALSRAANNSTTANTLMIGDDIVSDVGGAQAAGMRAALVKTGKYEPSDESRHPNIAPDAIFANLAEAADFLLLKQQECVDDDNGDKKRSKSGDSNSNNNNNHQITQ